VDEETFMTLVIQEALRVAQDLDVAVFPVGADKRPIIKGWRAKASSNPDEIEAMFSLHGAAGVAIPCGPKNDLICFDLDFGHTDDEDRKARLMAWAEAFMADAEGKVEVRRTRSGGMHILAAWPDDQPPRRIMPKLDVIIDGFYFVFLVRFHLIVVHGFHAHLGRNPRKLIAQLHLLPHCFSVQKVLLAELVGFSLASKG